MRRRERNWMPEVLWFHLQRSKPQALEFSSPTRRSLPASTTLSHIPHPPAQRPGRPHHCAHGLRRSCSSVVTRIFCGLIWKKKSRVVRDSLPVQRGSGQVQVKRITPQVGWTALGGGKLFADSSLSIWAQCLERKGKTKGGVCAQTQQQS